MSLTLRATGTLQEIDAAEVMRAASILFEPNHMVQIQALPSGRCRLVKGDDTDGIVRTVREYNDEAGVYWSLNPCDKATGSGGGILANDMLCRRWLLIDVDPERGKEENTTDDEHDAAREIAGRIFDALCEIGFPQPISLDSGNGWHLLYRIDLPNDDVHKAILRDVLYVLADQYDTWEAKIDRKTHNANRISKMPGTWARKASHTKERPQRMARFNYVPDSIDVVSLERLKKLASRRQTREPARPPPAPKSGPLFQLRAGEGGERGYAQAALRYEVQRVKLAAIRTRNNVVNDAAFRLGTLAGANLLMDQEIESEIVIACHANGLMESESAKTVNTIKRAIAAGRQHPRSIPERKDMANGHAKTSDTATPTDPPKDEDKCQWELLSNEEVLAEGLDDDLKATLYTGRPKRRRFQIWTLDELVTREFPAPNWAIAGLLSEGLNIMAGAPKMGKSMMALNLAITIAGGGHALGEIKVTPGDVLYLSLEDKDRRVQARARKMQSKLGIGGSRRLSVVTTWPRQDEGGLWLIDQWVKQCERPTLVIIDVWGRFRTPRNVRGEMYEQDSTTLAAVKQFVDERNFSALVLHHTRKAQAEDFMETLLGTQGIAGAADGVIHLQRTRGSNEAIVSVVGRDEPQKQLAVEFDPDSLTWRSLGTAEEHVGGKLQSAVLGYLKLRGGSPTFPSDIAEHLQDSPD
jgi:hypothetical protein